MLQTAGPRGPALLEDVWFLEKLAHFDREVIPERRMHAKGSGAFGTFTVTHDITQYTRAKIFSDIGKKTEMFARFSTVAGERGAADAERDIRGFALKFYTEEGNWDLVGNNTPVFFLRDPLKFPDLNHAIKRDPRTGLRSAESNWDFWTQLPEALHQVTIVMSERGIPKTFRHMHGFGSHTFSFINAENERYWVKFHFRYAAGHREPDGRRRLKRWSAAIARRTIATFTKRSSAAIFLAGQLSVQIMPEKDASSYHDQPVRSDQGLAEKRLSAHRSWRDGVEPECREPFRRCRAGSVRTGNVVPGISFSPDKMLQGRLFSYGDAQRYRLA